MGSTSYELVDIQAAAVSVSTSYGSARSDEFDASFADEMLFIFDYDAGTGNTQIDLLLEVEDDAGAWHDLYRADADGVLSEEVVSLAVTALSIDNTFAFVVDTRALRNCRWKYKSTGGNGTMQNAQASISKATR